MFDQFKDEIKKQALDEFPNECCGIFIEKGGTVFIKKCPNVAKDKAKHFYISPIFIVKALDGGKLIGYYHSHKNNVFSCSDLQCSVAHKLPILCYSHDSGDFIEFNDFRPFSGRIFEIGKNDCFTLIRDYYLKVYNVKINDYPRGEDWADKTPNIYLENYEKEGFFKVCDGFDEELVKIGDVMLLKYVKTVEHAAIYLGNEILHHPRCKISLYEPLTEKFKKKTVLVVRHESLRQH